MYCCFEIVLLAVLEVPEKKGKARYKYFKWIISSRLTAKHFLTAHWVKHCCLRVPTCITGPTEAQWGSEDGKKWDGGTAAGKEQNLVGTGRNRCRRGKSSDDGTSRSYSIPFLQPPGSISLFRQAQAKLVAQVQGDRLGKGIWIPFPYWNFASPSLDTVHGGTGEGGGRLGLGHVREKVLLWVKNNKWCLDFWGIIQDHPQNPQQRSYIPFLYGEPELSDVSSSHRKLPYWIRPLVHLAQYCLCLSRVSKPYQQMLWVEACSLPLSYIPFLPHHGTSQILNIQGPILAIFPAIFALCLCRQ